MRPATVKWAQRRTAAKEAPAAQKAGEMKKKGPKRQNSVSSFVPQVSLYFFMFFYYSITMLRTTTTTWRQRPTTLTLTTTTTGNNNRLFWKPKMRWRWWGAVGFKLPIEASSFEVDKQKVQHCNIFDYYYYDISYASADSRITMMELYLCKDSKTKAKYWYKSVHTSKEACMARKWIWT